MNELKKKKAVAIRKSWVAEHRILSFSLVGVVLVFVGVVVIVGLRSVTVPDPKSDLSVAVKFAASDGFNRLSLEEQRKFMNAFGEDGRRQIFRNQKLSEDERHKLMDNLRPVRQAEMKERMNKFFKMSKEEQNAELDKDIARMKEMQARRRQGQNQQQGTSPRDVRNTSTVQQGTSPRDVRNTSTAQQGNPRGGRVAPSAQQRRERYEEMEPSTHAQMQEYRQMLRLRQEGKR